MDRLRALEVFKAVVAHGNFTKAADALDLSCAAVGRVVNELEALLGVRLFQRTTRRISLTGVGSDVLAKALQLLDCYEELESMGRARASEPIGSLRLLASSAYARSFLGASLGSFMMAFPEVAIDLQTRDTPLDLGSEDFDAAICLEDELLGSLIARPIGSMTMGLYACPAYLARKGATKLPSDLGQHEFLVPGAVRSPVLLDLNHRITGSAESVSVRVVLNCCSMDVLTGAAVNGAGVVVLPIQTAQQLLATGALVEVMRDWFLAPQPVYIAYGSRNNIPMSVRKLVDHFVQTLGSFDGGLSRQDAREEMLIGGNAHEPSVQPSSSEAYA
jgi:DNA-binding transcriptional LysR family regulator